MGQTTRVDLLAGKALSPFDSEKFEKLLKGLEISIVLKSEIMRAKRFDAETFKPEYIEIENKLNSVRSVYLNEIVGRYTNGAEVRNFVDKGFPYIRVSNTSNDFFVNFNEVKYISKEDFERKSKQYFLNKNDLLLNRSGTLGFCQIINFDRALFSSHNIRLSDITINPYYLCTFLNSYFGKKQIFRYSNGAVVPEINHLSLNLIKIPLLSQTFQLEIEKLVKQAHKKQSQAKQLYRAAEQLLLEELHLVDYKPKEVLFSTIRKKDIDQANRFDAEYFQPNYQDIIEKIEGYRGGCCKVKDKFLQNKKLSVKDEQYYNYIEIGDVNISNGEVKYNKLKTSEVPANGKIELVNSDLLISKVRPYRGAVGIVNFELKNLLGSGAFTVLKENSDYKKEVLQVFLRIKYIRDYLLKFNVGTSYPVIKDENILNLKIPLIPSEVQIQIAEKIQLSHQLRKDSKKLLEAAKQQVEKKIEKLVKEAHEKQKRAEQLYHAAEQLLLEELELVNYKPKKVVFSTIRKKDIDQANRFDAEYFQPKYQDIIEKIERYRGGVCEVGDFDFNRANFFPKKTEEYFYIPLSKVSNKGEIEIPKKELGKNLPTRARRQVKEGEVILSSIEGCLETSALIQKEHDNFIVSNGFYVFKSSQINSETLLILFKSKIMLALLARISKGAILGGYDLDSFQTIKVPLIVPKVQIQIAEKIQLSHQLRKESRDLLEEAKGRVEAEIEKEKKNL